LLSKNTKINICRTIILLFLYGCETWSLTLREDRRLRVFENRVLGKIFGLKRDKVTREWRKLRNEELNDLYSSPNIFSGDQIVNNELGRTCNKYGEREGLCRVLVGKPEGKRSLRITRHGLEDNIKIDLQEVGYGGMD